MAGDFAKPSLYALTEKEIARALFWKYMMSRSSHAGPDPACSARRYWIADQVRNDKIKKRIYW